MKNLIFIVLCAFISIPTFGVANTFQIPDSPIIKGHGCPSGKCPSALEQRILEKHKRCFCNQCLPLTPANEAYWRSLQKQYGTLQCDCHGGNAGPRESNYGDDRSPRVLW